MGTGRPVRAASAVLILAVTLALAGTAALAQAPPTTDPAEACKQATPVVVFVGTATDIVDETVTFDVTQVVRGVGSADTAVDVTYPTVYNARQLELGTSYRVAATSERDRLFSVVPTADKKSCGQSTRLANGSRIDTGALVGVKDQGPDLVKKVGVGLLGVLVLLIILGRLFDRPAGYRWHLRR